jgi:hypothetical protein
MNAEQSQMWGTLSDASGNFYSQATERERETYKKWIRSLLETTVATVDFVKADGEFRSMKCTLSEEQGAKYVVKENQEKPVKKSNPEVCVVWDTTQNAWRSFRWDRIKRIQFDLG